MAVLRGGWPGACGAGGGFWAAGRLATKIGASELASLPAARDFVTDAYAHCKFIGHNGAARPLFEASGLAPLIDDGFISLDDHSAAEFIGQCSLLRYWARQQVGVLS